MNNEGHHNQRSAQFDPNKATILMLLARGFTATVVKVVGTTATVEFCAATGDGQLTTKRDMPEGMVPPGLIKKYNYKLHSDPRRRTPPRSRVRFM